MEIEKIIYRTETVYHSGVSVSSPQEVTNNEDLRKIALDMIKDDDSIKEITICNVVFYSGKEYGETRNIDTLKGRNKKKNYFKDPHFYKMYCDLWSKQD